MCVSVLSSCPCLFDPLLQHLRVYPSSPRTEVRRNRYKVVVDADEGHRRQEDTMVEIRKNRREESLQKKRCEGLQSQQIPSSLHSTVIEKKNPNVLICTPNFTIGSNAEKIVGWALNRHLMQNVETDPNAKLVFSCESLKLQRGIRKTLNSELWHACAGPLVSLPQVGSLVFYFPQGHSEQVAASTRRTTTSQIPNYPNLPYQLMCQVQNVTLHVNVGCWLT
ncbi:hypothetical protein JHK87_000705 [Glycine soja]|nr:hypothetical protein JHK87_000705 [Glycine soja]